MHIGQLDLASYFDIVFYREDFTCVFTNNIYGYRGFLFEPKENGQLKKEFRVSDESDVKELLLECYVTQSIESFKSLLAERKKYFDEKDHAKYVAWKKDFDKEKNKTNYSKPLTVAATICILVVLYILGKNLISGDYKFKGDSIAIKRGRVIHAHQSTSQLGSYQFLRIQYEVNQKDYIIADRVYSQTNFRQEGDIVLLEVDTVEPTVCRLK